MMTGKIIKIEPMACLKIEFETELLARHITIQDNTELIKQGIDLFELVEHPEKYTIKNGNVEKMEEE